MIGCPTSYREPISTLVADLERKRDESVEHEHVIVQIGAGTRCVICGAFTGSTSVVLPDVDWEEWQRIHAVAQLAIRESEWALPGLHAETVADFLGAQIAYAMTGEPRA